VEIPPVMTARTAKVLWKGEQSDQENHRGSLEAAPV
jgi:hypothetical protein